jgi:hypothetical protein
MAEANTQTTAGTANTAPAAKPAAPVAAPKSKVQKYRIKHGKHYVRDKDGNELVFVKGDVTTFTPREVVAFRDKLEPVEDSVRVSPGRPAKPDNEEPGLQVVPKAE